MALPALHKKLLRELTRLKGQILTIAFVLASGLTCFIALRGTYDSLERSQQEYYDSSRFAHVFARLVRAPESVAQKLAAIPGVSTLDTRVVKEVSVPIEGMARPAYGVLLSVQSHQQPQTNALHVQSGRLPSARHADEVALLASFADAHGLHTGDRLPVIIQGKQRSLRITGIVLSPEFVFAAQPGAMVDDPKRFAVLWMERSALTAAYQLEGAFNDVSLRLSPGTNEAAVLSQVDRILTPYGGDGAIARKDQRSDRIVTQELSQLKALAGMVPAVFLAVAAFLVNLVLGRLVRLQRAEIATLKAVGYRNREIARHYLGLVLVVLIPGGVLGVLGGLWLGRQVFALYEGIFRFPAQRFLMSAQLVLLGLGICAALALFGALLAVRTAVRMAPAEAMRPEAPARYRRGLVERLGLSSLLGPVGLMVTRELARRPLRTLLSSLGIAGAIALIILGRFGVDMLQVYLESTYQREHRQDLTVSFVEPVSTRALGELTRMKGVTRAEGVRTVPVRASHQQRQRDCVLLGLPSHAELRQILEQPGEVVSAPEGGVLVSRALANALLLKTGDSLKLDLREGQRLSVAPRIVGMVDDTVGMWVYAQAPLVAALSRDQGAVSTLLLQVEPEHLLSVEAQLRRSPRIIDVSDIRADLQRLNDTNTKIMDVWTLVSITLSACIIFGVVYNNARIALEASSRELGSLRVLGFSRGEVSTVLIGSLACELLLALPLGLWLGHVWAQLFMERAMDPEIVRWPIVIAPRTYLLAAVVALLAGAASALWVRRNLDHLDLIGVLKTRE